MFFLESTGFIGFTRLPFGFIPVSYWSHRFHTPAAAKGKAFELSSLTEQEQANEMLIYHPRSPKGPPFVKGGLVAEGLLN